MFLYFFILAYIYHLNKIWHEKLDIMKKTQEEIAVGTRLECDGHRGTVLFVGEVPPTKGK